MRSVLYRITTGFHGVQCMSRAIQVDGVLVNWYSNRRCTELACEIDMWREVYPVDMELSILP